MKFRFKKEFLDAFEQASRLNLGVPYTAGLLEATTLVGISKQINSCLNWVNAERKNIYPLKGKTWREVYHNPELVIITKCVNL